MSKYTLYACNFCPFSRKVRFFLEEMGINYQLAETKYWLRKPDFISLNQACETPVLKNIENNQVIVDSFLICDYINNYEKKEEELGYFDFLGYNLSSKYEIQRLHMWFDKKFYNEITKYFIDEIFLNYVNGKNDTNSIKINVAINNFNKHANYMEFLLSKRKWLACDLFTIADISASTQISIIDYLGYIDWNKYKKLKEWYITIKSKKGFRNILYEKIPGFKPSKYYSELDF